MDLFSALREFLTVHPTPGPSTSTKVLGGLVSYYKIWYDEEVVVCFVFFPINSVTCGWVICHLNLYEIKLVPQSDKKWR